MLRPSHGPVTPPPKVFPSATPPEVFQIPLLPESLFKRHWLSNRGEISFAWVDVSSDKNWAIVSVSVATIALSAAVAITRLVRASMVSAW